MSIKSAIEMHLRVFLVAQLLFLIHSNGSSSLSRDYITPTEPLKDGQVLVSGDSSAFALGFFSPGNTTGRRYVGIWYNKVSEQTVVWVANRDRPVNGTNGVLSVAEDGNLILSSDNFTLWSTELGDNQLINNLTSTESRSSPSPGAGPRAVLLDSGNLEVRVAGSQNAAWQSFDHPCNVFLPGMQLGVNRRTGLNHSLNSWRSEDDPGRGNYTFGVGPGSGPPEFYVYKDGSSSGPVWRTGPWVGGRWSGVPEMTRGYIFNYTFVDSGDVVYATYGIRNPSVVSIFMLDGESGTVQRKTWHQSSRQWTKFWAVPLQDCDQYANCGPFGLCTPNQEQFECSCLTGYEPKSTRDWYLRDGTGGCRRASNISMCGNGEGFLKLSNVKVPDTTTAMSNKSMGLEECRQECFKNCSCTAFTTATDTANGAAGCIWFHGDLLDTREYDVGAGQDLFFRVDKLVLAKSLDTSKAHLNKKHLAIILVCALVAFAFSIFFVIWLYRKRRRDYKEQKQRSLWLGEDDESNSKSDLPVFPRSAIVTATQNFDPANLLGQGGFGPVYKGKLSNGMEIAVKRLSKYSGQGINEFKNEVRLIAKLQHRNLVKTLGCCVRGEEKMLVYEYLPNKSLDNYIFDEEKRKLLDWRTRYDIILGIAKGVLYLHQDSTLKIIHRDLKASNILLDEKMVPKISDFGMARIFGNDQSEANTNRVVGTYGYMSPEYAMEGHFSIKSDVFSFGVILLEIISGKKSSGYYNDNASTNLSGYAWKLWQEGKRIEIVDESVRWSANSSEDEILRCIQIGLLCVQESPEERPSMLDVIFMLNNKLDLRNPNEPAFIVKGNQHKYEDSLSSSTQAHSVNDITITDVDGR